MAKENEQKHPTATPRDDVESKRRDLEEQVGKMVSRGMNPEEFKDYLMIHKYGTPPHGGLGLGLERLTMRLLGLDNVRHASMFPRDLNRLEP